MNMISEKYGATWGSLGLVMPPRANRCLLQDQQRAMGLDPPDGEAIKKQIYLTTTGPTLGLEHAWAQTASFESLL